MAEISTLSEIYVEKELVLETQRKLIYLVKNRSSGELCVAKVQVRREEAGPNERTVRHEGKFLLEMQGHIGIPLMRW